MSERPLVRPFVTANFAITADGRISTRNHTPADFSSPRDKKRFLEIRSEADAVLVGARTIAADSMSVGLPDAALRKARVKRGQAPYPHRVIVSNGGKILPELKVFQTPDLPTPIVFSTRRMSRKTADTLAPLCDLYLHLADRVNLRSLLATLREDYGIKRVICEGGGALLRSLAAEDLIDELHLTICPVVFGGKGAVSLTGVASATYLPISTQLRLVEMLPIGDECFTRWRVKG